MAEDERDEKKARSELRLGLKDYLALAIAAIETFLLPLIVLVVVMVVLALLLASKP